MGLSHFYSPWAWQYELQWNMDIIKLYNSLARVCGTMYHMSITLFWLIDFLFIGNTHVMLCELLDKQLYIIIALFQTQHLLLERHHHVDA